MKRIIAAALAAFLSGAVLPSTAIAETTESWQFDGSLYVYVPTIGGTTTFPENGEPNVTINTSSILDVLKMAFMGTLGLRKGRWGAFTDVYYVDLGNTQSATSALTIGGTRLPADASADVTMDIKSAVWTVAGSYRVSADRGSPLDLFAGARLLDLKETLRWQLSGNIGSIALPDLAGDQATRLTNWDGILGVRGRFALGADEKWFIPYYLDFGAGNSDRTVQAVGGVGYAFKWGDLTASWRYLDYKMKASSNIQSFNLSGPAIGAVFHW
jgi:hypothetical protein